MAKSNLQIEEKLSFLNQQKQIDEEEDSNFLSNLDFIKFLIVAKRNIFWVLLIMCLAFLTAYLYIRYSSPIYESSALLKLEVASKGDLVGLNRNNNNPYVTNDLSGEIELIKSTLVLNQVADVMKMDIFYFAKGKILSEERYNSSPFEIKNYSILNDEIYNKNINVEFTTGNKFLLSYSIGTESFEKEYFLNERIQTPYFQCDIVPTVYFQQELPHAEYFFIFNNKQAQLSYIFNNLSVEIINPEAATLAIAFKNNHPHKAKDFVVAIDSIYTKEGLENKYRSSEQTIKYLMEQIKNNEEKMEAYEKEIQNFIVKNKSLDLKGDVLKNIAEVEKIDKEIALLRSQVIKINEIFDLITNESILNEAIIMPSENNLTAISNLITQYNTVKKQREILAVSNKENTTVIRLNEMELSSIKKQAFKIIEQEKKKLYEKIAEINAVKKKLEESIYNATPKDNDLKKIQRLYAFYERLYLMSFDKKIEFEMLKASTVPNFRVLSEPIVSRTPISPIIPSVYSYAAAIGFALSFIWVVIQYFLHNTIDNVGELEKSTVAPILGFIPKYTRARLSHSMLVIDKSPKGAISEALRTIRTNIEFLLPNKNYKTISLTSTISGEGKTFVSINLAGVIAFSGKKVVIIDLDMRRPKIHTAFEDQNLVGISSILIGQEKWENCIRNTTIDTLKYITSGPIPPNPSELIIGDSFDILLDELKKEFDIVIIDSPPAGLVTDGILIMKKVDLPIYVVRAEYSKKGFEKNINRLVLKNDFKKLCVVLNDFSNLSGYGYGYGYYSKNEQSNWIEVVMKKISSYLKK
ncbi:MAG: polysaccharide biosynthesis tyrosine autokinase [Bacteroidota bacterium]|nr:polysaccharide biosynthesis tyrosine autokinase [Bacteroidota bacterium]